MAVYPSQIMFTAKGLSQNDQSLSSRLEHGRDPTMVAHSAAAIPFNQFSSQKLAGALKSANAQIEGLDKDVQLAQKINQKHEASLSEFQVSIQNRARRLKTYTSNERTRGAPNILSGEKSQTADLFSKAGEVLFANDQNYKHYHEKRQDEFLRLGDLFHEQLQQRAPVTLWKAQSRCATA
ncbi:MAG: hypothetical protein ACRBB0_03970 [Pelagimonas sp.]|uniref:hypothetical protein n=1 Tax=Pelagimonas sp. TaxID=2073170 RepID=UPI003D6B78D1